MNFFPSRFKSSVSLQTEPEKDDGPFAFESETALAIYGEYSIFWQ